MERVARIFKFGDPTPDRERVTYWLNRSPEERMAAVEELRRHEHGDIPRLERVARVVELESG